MALRRLSLCAAAVAALATARGEGCGMQAGLCICEDADGDAWDLTPLGGDHVVTGPSNDAWDFDYHFNFCDNTETPPTPPCSFSSTMAYRVQTMRLPNGQCFNMGADVANPGIPQEVTKIDGDASLGVSVKFSAPVLGVPGQVLSLTVTLACNEGNQGLATFPAAPGYQTAAVTTWETYYSCPGAQGGALAWGWPLLIVVSVSVSVYVGGGVGYNYKQTGGEIAHPHVDYWKQFQVDFIGLVSDGVWFSRKRVAENIKPLAFIAPADMSRPPSFDGEVATLLKSGDGETSTAGRTSKSSRGGKKSSKSSKEKRRSKDKDKGSRKAASEKRVTAPTGRSLTVETERERRDREIHEIGTVGDRVDDIESKEGGTKAPKE